MEIINKGLEMMMCEFKKEFGENEKLKDGDSIVGVFNDAVIVAELINKELKINIHAGEPYKFDYSLGLLDSEDTINHDKNPCTNCDCYDADMGCTMPSVDRGYACPMEAATESES